MRSRCASRAALSDAAERVGEVGPADAGEEERVLGRPGAASDSSSLHRRLVRPVEILEEEHQRPLPRPAARTARRTLLKISFSIASPSSPCDARRRARRPARRPISVATNGSTSSTSSGRSALHGRARASRQPPRRPSSSSMPRPVPQQVDEGMEAEPLSDRQRAPLEHGDAVAASSAPSSAMQARLADAGLADHARRCRPVLAHRRRATAPSSSASSRVATDEGRGCTRDRRRPSAGACARCSETELVGGDRALFPLERQRRRARRTRTPSPVARASRARRGSRSPPRRPSGARRG